MRILANALAIVPPDQWREAAPFSTDMQNTQSQLLGASSEQERERALTAWLKTSQPCLFGRAAASLGAIDFCFITEPDIEAGDEFVKQKIRSARLSWLRRGALGQSSAFIIHVISEKLAYAAPGPVAKRFAQRLCSLYLLQEVDCDVIYHDSIFLDLTAGPADHILRWLVGVNYFAAHGDKRWWHDHRIPGGIALSMNSVGHLVKAGKLSTLGPAFEKALGLPSGKWSVGRIDSTSKALDFAMRTIDGAATTVSGRATQLLPRPAHLAETDIPPVSASVAAKDRQEYIGYYHTDHTLPSTYFEPPVERPAGLQPLRLDFTYLYDSDSENFDYERILEGVPIRGGETSGPGDGGMQVKGGRAVGESVRKNDYPLLLEALRHRS